MKLALIGFGQAGGKIVDKFLLYDKQTKSNIVREAVAINTAKADLMGLAHVSGDKRIMILSFFKLSLLGGGEPGTLKKNGCSFSLRDDGGWRALWASDSTMES